MTIIVNEVLRHLGAICAMDRATLAILFVLCAASAYALREYLAYPILAVLTFPVLFGASVLTQYLFILGEVYIPNKLDQWLMWTVIAAICGNIAGIAAVAASARLTAKAVPAQRRPSAGTVSASRIRG